MRLRFIPVLTLLIGFVYFHPAFANHPLTFSEFFQAVPEAGMFKSCPYSSSLVGKVFTAPNGQKYEIRAFSFEDTQNNLSKGKTFQQYIADKELLQKSSTLSSPCDLEFQSFRFQSMNLEDGVYFMLALKHHPI